MTIKHIASLQLPQTITKKFKILNKANTIAQILNEYFTTSKIA